MSGAISGDHRDGPLEQAQFRNPRQLNFDDDGNLFLGDEQNHCIRQIDTKSGMVSTIIGIPKTAGDKDGNKDEATFKNPHGIVVDSEGIIYASDWGNKKVRRIAIE
jgi:streptogramin lyase